MTCTSTHPSTIHEHLYVESVEAGVSQSSQYRAKVKATFAGPRRPQPSNFPPRNSYEWDMSLHYIVPEVENAPKAGSYICVTIVGDPYKNDCAFMPQASEQAPPANTTEGDLAEKRAILFPADFE